MKLNEHFLPEDIWSASDELVNLQKNCIRILDNSLNGQFTNREEFLKQINHSSKILMELNKKKISYEKHDGEDTRRHYF